MSDNCITLQGGGNSTTLQADLYMVSATHRAQQHHLDPPPGDLRSTALLEYNISHGYNLLVTN